MPLAAQLLVLLVVGIGGSHPTWQSNGFYYGLLMTDTALKITFFLGPIANLILLAIIRSRFAIGCLAIALLFSGLEFLLWVKVFGINE